MYKANVTNGATGPSKLVKPKFGPGMLLQHEDLEQLTDYTRDLNRLLFRSLFGCGVICGLKVEAGINCDKVAVTVHEGLALSCVGDAIHVPKKQEFYLEEPRHAGTFWVVLCRTELSCSPRTSICSSDCDEPSPVPARIRDGFEIKVVPKPPACACGCHHVSEEEWKRYESTVQRLGTDECKCQCVDPDHPCYKKHYDGECECCCGDGCQCDCVVLAKFVLGEDDAEKVREIPVDHSVRRFIRPVLMRDPELRERADNAKLEESDDLTKIDGIGPRIAQVLANVEITSFARLAKSTPDELKAILKNNKLDLIAPDTKNWIKQARILANEGIPDESRSSQQGN